MAQAILFISIPSASKPTIMRKYILTLLTFFLLQSLSSQTSNPLDSAWIRDNYTKKEIMVPMRDGIKLFTSVYIPNDNSEPHPILMNRTPYSCAPYGEKNYRTFWDSHWRYYMRRNYIMVSLKICGHLTQ
jgi:uncharacterized protein